MESLKKINWTPLLVVKAAGILLGGVVVLALVFQLFNAMTGGVPGIGMRSGITMTPSAPDYYGGGVSAPSLGYGSADGSVAYENSTVPQLSPRNIAVPSPQPGGSIGADAEAFEVTEYSARIETRDSKSTCPQVAELKTKESVIFENTNEYDGGCSFRFKVAHDSVSDVLTVIKSFNPKDLSENTYTIKQQLDDFTSETDILVKKLATIDETLLNGVKSYDELVVVATKAGDVESLTNVISNKLNLIERLTQERINTSAQLERLSRSKAEQIDRLEYTYFSISVYENKFIDGKNLQESWKGALQEFVRDINRTAQDISINLVSFLFVLVQYILYFLILLVIAKYLWKVTRSVWKE